MAVAMLIALWINDELTYDKYHKNYDRIVQVMQHQTFNGYKGTEHSIPMPLVAEMKSKYGSDFKYLVMASWQGRPHSYLPVIRSYRLKEIIWMRMLPGCLSLKMMKGTEDGLKDPHSILLSASTAKAIFGNEDPMNKLMKIGNKLDVKVTGVYEDLPYNSQFQ